MKFFRISVILLILGAICILPLGCGSDTTAAPQTVTVQRGNITTEITSVGNLDYADAVDLTFGIDCTVSEVLVQAGDTVKKVSHCLASTRRTGRRKLIHCPTRRQLPCTT